MTDFDDLAERADDLRAEAKVSAEERLLTAIFGNEHEEHPSPTTIPGHHFIIMDMHQKQYGKEEGYGTREDATNAALILRHEVQVPLQVKMVAR